MSRWREIGSEPPSQPFDLASLLDHYGVRYSPSRTEQMVSCPLHEDRTPSLSINLTEGKFFCHSCDLAGKSATTFIMHKEGLDVDGARAVVAALGLTEGVAGGGDEPVRGSAYGSRDGNRRSAVAQGSRDRRGHGRYVPPWRRS